MLGRDAYLRIFHQAERKLPNDVTQHHRVIRGELVGQLLPQGAGEQQQDPLLCSHPTDQMRKRGNKGGRWWTCLSCRSRWERIPLDAEQLSREPQDSDLVTFGKYSGKTYLSVIDDLSYCQWVMMTAESDEETSQGLRRLAKYLLAKSQEAPSTSPEMASQTDMEI